MMQKRLLTRCLPALALAWLLASTGEGSLARSESERLPEIARREERVGPGTTHIQEFHSSGPLLINILKVDLSSTGVNLRASKGKGPLFTGATVLDMVRRVERTGQTVVGGVNADFWVNSPRMFVPVNLFVSEGMTHTLPHQKLKAPRAVFGITESGKVVISPMQAKLEIRAGKGRAIECKLNEWVTSRGAVLFTPIVGEPIPTKQFSKALLLEQMTPEFVPNRPARARVLRAIEGTTVTLTSGTLLLAFHRDQLSFARELRPGSELALHVRVPQVAEPLKLCLGGGPMLIKNGRVYVDWKEERILRSFSADRHPRTAIGIGEDGRTLYLVTVDGRQPLRSIGMGLYELALFMKSLGCRDAMNFDGGGSTTMVVRGEVVNKPSDRLGPRTVTNALLVISEAKPGSLAYLQIYPTDELLLVPAGATVELKCRGFDQNYSPLKIADGLLTWTADSAVGNLVTSGSTCLLRAAESPADGEVVATTCTTTTQECATARKRIRVVRIDELQVEPEVVVVQSRECVPFEIRAQSGSVEVPLRPEMVELLFEDKKVTATLNQICGVTTAATTLIARVGKIEKRIPCYVNLVDSRIVESFDSPVTATVYGTRFDKKKTALVCDPKRAHSGSGCLAFRYAMTRGGISKIAFPLNVKIPGRPARLGMWIYGDGKEAWVRGEVEDAVGNRFLLDFTDGSTGVYWKKEWRRVVAPLHKLVPRPQNPGAKPQFPITLRELYVAQDQEALKAQGELLFDELCAEYPPNINPDSTSPIQ
ncbi:MAG: phosphodiester glycosidase family protein [Candidatus Sumerlaea chitinivorans]|nr:phosphodiester glycosidase family protein [Candidatus Sumerlaea chitinivorans]